jgi:hypothetical protein
MGNDNEDRRHPFVKTATITSLEERVNELYGDTVFSWTIGRTMEDDGKTVWFYYAGDLEQHHGKWRVSGHADSIADCLVEMIQKFNDV